MTCCDKLEILRKEQYLVQGHDGPNRVDFHNYNPVDGKQYFLTVYISYCPFCGKKL